jgi:hypothetical protein
MELTDDFELLVEYLSRLFSIKKMHEIAIHQYAVKYMGYRDVSADIVREDFPDRNSLDRIKSLKVSVTDSTTGVSFLLELSWDKAESIGGTKDAVKKFIETLDTSTFRYF